MVDVGHTHGSENVSSYHVGLPYLLRNLEINPRDPPLRHNDRVFAMPTPSPSRAASRSGNTRSARVNGISIGQQEAPALC